MADIDERKRAEAERAEFAAKQAQIAETLQRSLLLAPAPDALPGVDLFTLYEPASDEAMVGGDFFDAFAAGGDGERVILVVGDVTGKGLRAAAETAEVKFALRAYLREYPWPQVALSRLNDYLLERQRLEGKPTDVFISLAVAVLDRRTGAGTVAAAGMEPPLLFRVPRGGGAGAVPTRVEEIPARGMMLGALPDWEGDALPFTMGPDDLLLLCSDGITEARPFRGSRGIFGIDGVARAALAAPYEHTQAGGTPLDSVGRAVVEAARGFAGGRLGDDACLLLARRRPDPL